MYSEQRDNTKASDLCVAQAQRPGQKKKQLSTRDNFPK